jgi:glutaredoxin
MLCCVTKAWPDAMDFFLRRYTMTLNRTPRKRACIVAMMGLSAVFSALPSAQAQQLYRSVGPDGKVTFSDKPPQDSKNSATIKPGAAAGDTGAALPFELRQIATRFPVTLYTSKDCTPCGTARTYLSSRGVPFNERTVNSNADIEALKRLAGDATLPLATVGSQQLKGFSDQEWGQYIDAAGYPKTSALPSGFRNAAPAPLVAVQATPATAPAATAAAPDTTPRAIPAPAPSNPAGIRF